MNADRFLPADLAARLRANAAVCGADHVPLVKFFNPVGAATWLATELADDGDTLFGLADLGFGFPELGSFSLAELRSVRLPLGLTIERDEYFATAARLSAWAEAARAAGSILGAVCMLAAVEAREPGPD